MYAQNFYILHSDGTCSLKDFIVDNFTNSTGNHIPLKDLAEIMGFYIDQEKEYDWSLGGWSVKRISGWDYRNHEDSKTPPEHIALIETVLNLSNEWHALHADSNNDDWAKIDDLVVKHDMLVDDDDIALGDKDFYSYPDYKTLQAFHADLKTLVDKKAKQ